MEGDQSDQKEEVFEELKENEELKEIENEVSKEKEKEKIVEIDYYSIQKFIPANIH